MEKKKFTGWKQLASLKSEHGTLCAWFIDDTTANMKAARFETMERARTYASLYNDMLASIDLKPVQWTFGTLAKMEAAKIEAVFRLRRCSIPTKPTFRPWRRHRRRGTPKRYAYYRP